MLLNTDWYITQMKSKAYESDPLPVTLPAKKYYDGVNNQVFIVEKTKDPVEVSTIIDWVNSENKATKVQISPTEILDIIPSRTIRIPVDKEKVLASGAKTTFWKVLKEYIEEVVNNLDEVNEMAISQGADYEEIGKNAIVVSATKGIIKKIINKVEDSREESEKARKA